jgi:signal transduction histidine kinase/DNA-binding response OmpR family regulator/CHASE3 domain sensor protein
LDAPNERRAANRQTLRKLQRGVGGTLPPATFAGFAVALLAVVAISLFSFRALSTRAESARRVTNTLEAVAQLESVHSLLKDAETGQRGYLLTGEDAYLEPYRVAVAALPPQLARARHAIIDDPAQSRRLTSVELLVKDKLGELERTIELRQSGRSVEALSLVRADLGRQLMQKIRRTVDELLQAERAELAARNTEWARSSRFATLVTSAGALLLLVLIVLAAVISSRDFRRQSLKNWLTKGQSELALRLQGEQTLAALGDASTAFLSRYLDAQVATAHFGRSERGLSMIGAWGTARAPSSDAPADAPGLTAQALREKDVLHVRDVPEGYLCISSGVGRRTARELVLASVTADGEPLGVLELGFFRQLAEHELELVARVREVLGTAFRSAEYRTKLQELLEETQRQAEELQTQQEELRVSNEELEQQTRTLQQSQERLSNQQAELEEINAQLEEQTQSLERQRQDLTRAQGELQRASAYKSEFLANMSHELRTPLNSSLILAKLLMDNRAKNLTPEQVKFAQTIYSAGNDLLVLINDILDLSRIEAGKLEVRPERLPLARLSEELSNTFQPLARDKSLELGVSLASDLPDAIVTDPTRLQQILRNLLSNAIKFTDRGGVFLSIRRGNGRHLVFEVRDTGIGIPRDQHAVIFEAFRQADGTSNRKYGGTGLGLSISRDLARLLGGELSLESAPGQGSTFTLVLPEEQLGPAGARALPPPAYPAPRPVTPPAPPVALPRGAFEDDRARLTPGERSILIIDDDAAFTRILFDLAHELEFSALVAETAEQGIALAEHYRPSAILLDVGLPDRSGLSVLDALKHSPTTRHIPVHMLSASDHSQTALEMGALGYALKPIKREQLVEAFRRLEAKFTQKLRRVLVVEDDAVHRESTCRLLEGDAVETVAVGNAAEAMEQLGSTRFDCMVLDLSLPDKSGFELLADMTDRTESPPPVIVYTGRSLSREEEQLLRRFSTSIIIKGARSPERLLDEVTLFLHQVESELPPERQRMLLAARQRDAVFEGRRVLIVEDDVRNIFALTSVIEPLGAKIEVARNGREALEHLRDKPGVDLVLMDVMMPEMDGLEATREIRKQPALKKLPIIALTAKAMADDRENCLAAGANDYIAKPLDVDKLLSLARVWMPK